MNNRNAVPMHKSPSAANNTDKLPRTAAQHRRNQNESNRYCEKNRRPRQSRHTKRNQADNENPGGRPLTEIIDTGNHLLFRYAGARRERVHRIENIEKPPSDCEYQAADDFIEE